MATVRRFRGRSHSQSPRRLTQWDVGVSDAGTPVSGTGGNLWGTGSATSQKVTIVRIRGLFSFYVEAISAISSGFTGASGIGLVSDDAFAAGAVPELNEDIDFGWMWHSFFDTRGITATIADGSNADAVFVRQTIDVKAMRIQGPGMTLFGSTQIIAESGVATGRFFGRTRILDKLG